MSFELESPAVEGGGELDARFTCAGEDRSPPLHWGDRPDGTASLALVMEEVGGGEGSVHWLLYHMFDGRTGLPEGIPVGPRIFGTASQGKNDFDAAGYTGPCPPEGEERRYRFTLYALDREPDVGTSATREQLSSAMEGHVLETATLEVTASL